MANHVLHIQYPNMRGAIYLEANYNVTISSSKFTYNDPGPIFEKNQIVGLKDNNDDYANVIRASLIFVTSNSRNL